MEPVLASREEEVAETLGVEAVVGHHMALGVEAVVGHHMALGVEVEEAVASHHMVLGVEVVLGFDHMALLVDADCMTPVVEV